jgi:hypothetical protein
MSTRSQRAVEAEAGPAVQGARLLQRCRPLRPARKRCEAHAFRRAALALLCDAVCRRHGRIRRVAPVSELCSQQRVEISRLDASGGTARKAQPAYLCTQRTIFLNNVVLIVVSAHSPCCDECACGRVDVPHEARGRPGKLAFQRRFPSRSDEVYRMQLRAQQCVLCKYV